MSGGEEKAKYWWHSDSRLDVRRPFGLVRNGRVVGALKIHKPSRGLGVRTNPRAGKADVAFRLGAH